MDEIIIEQRESSDISEDNSLRQEVLWESRLEKLCDKWHDDCLIRAKRHDKKAQIHKSRFAYFSLPTIIIPLLLSALSNILTEYPLVLSFGMALTGILTGINTFYNHSKKQEKHYDFAGKFFKLSIIIEKEISKRKKDRQAADCFIERISMEYNDLVFNSPP